MNKKLIVLIVALECVFSVFLISIFGPMVESFHSNVLVSDLYLLDENRERLVAAEGEEIPSVTIGIPHDFDYEFRVVVETEEATDRTYTVTHNRTDEEIEITTTKNGFRVTFLADIANVTVTVKANDGSLKTAKVLITKAGGNTDLGGDF